MLGVQVPPFIENQWRWKRARSVLQQVTYSDNTVVRMISRILDGQE
jgi:hypothetical protein